MTGAGPAWNTTLNAARAGWMKPCTETQFFSVSEPQTIIRFKEKVMSDVKTAPDGISATRTLDAKGLSCPMPLLRTKKEMDKINSGEILEILGTDPGSRNDLPGWCDRSGHDYLGEKEDTGFIRFYIQKK
jgi:tRNA 2-thiouridine synthesizing protein A